MEENFSAWRKLSCDGVRPTEAAANELFGWLALTAADFGLPPGAAALTSRLGEGRGAESQWRTSSFLP